MRLDLITWLSDDTYDFSPARPKENGFLKEWRLSICFTIISVSSFGTCVTEYVSKFFDWIFREEILEQSLYKFWAAIIKPQINKPWYYLTRKPFEFSNLCSYINLGLINLGDFLRIRALGIKEHIMRDIKTSKCETLDWLWNVFFGEFNVVLAPWAHRADCRDPGVGEELVHTGTLAHFKGQHTRNKGDAFFAHFKAKRLGSEISNICKSSSAIGHRGVDYP